jgi:hypothetical protein
LTKVTLDAKINPMDWLAPILIILAFLFIFASLAGLVVLNTRSTPVQRWRLISRQARSDYLNARGTRHLALMLKARRRLAEQEKQLKAQLEQHRAYHIRLQIHLQTTQQQMPGNLEALAPIQARLSQVQSRLQEFGEARARIAQKTVTLNHEIGLLQGISPADFRRRLLDPTQTDPSLDHYLTGVYAEWEPVPAWFQDLVSQG